MEERELCARGHKDSVASAALGLDLNRVLAELGRRTFITPKGLALALGNKQTKTVTEHPPAPHTHPTVRHLATGSFSVNPSVRLCSILHKLDSHMI